tara:strand:- start:326 stop:451 length:126 start_codon:yes stop_codon:yes gene_type:complete
MINKKTNNKWFLTVNGVEIVESIFNKYIKIKVSYSGFKRLS